MFTVPYIQIKTELRMATNIESKKRELRTIVYSLIFFFMILIPLFFFAGLPFIYSFSLGYLICLVILGFGISSLRWGFSKKGTTFLKVVWGGLLLRLALFCLALIGVLKLTTWPLSGFLSSFFLFYLFLQYQYVRSVNENLTQAKK